MPRREIDVSGANVAVANVERDTKRISWGAIFAGAVLAAVVSIALNLLGLGIGALVIDPQARDMGGGGLGIGAAIWTTLASCIALFVGGWVAGRLGRSARRSDGILHGLITWGFVTLFGLYLVGGAVGSVFSGIFGLAGQSVPLAQNVDSEDVDRVQRELQDIPNAQERLRSAGGAAADVVGGASIVGALVLLIGGAVAGMGGALGARRNEATLGEPVADASYRDVH